MDGVNGHLIRVGGSTDDDFKPDDVERALHNDEILWLDLHDSSEESLALLRDVFHIHPVAVEERAVCGETTVVDGPRPAIALESRMQARHPLVPAEAEVAAIPSANAQMLASRIERDDSLPPITVAKEDEWHTFSLGLQPPRLRGSRLR